MSMLSSSDHDDDDSSLAIKELKIFRKTVLRCRAPPSVHHEIPVPDPLNPFLPHVIEADSTPVHLPKKPFTLWRTQLSFLRSPPVSLHAPAVPDPLAAFAACTSTSPDASMHGMPSDSIQEQVESSEPKLQCSAGCSDDIKTCLDRPNISENENVSSKRMLTVQTDKIQDEDALNSKPQRGKKRQNLNDLQRLELTRTCDRKHVKSTRMEKKSRHMELVEMEKMYLILKAQQDLSLSRRNRLIEIIEGTSSVGVCQDEEDCPHIQRLRQLSSEKLECAQVSVFGGAPDTIALAENAATVKVLVNGTEGSSGESNHMLAFLSVEFHAASAEICSMSLFWITPETSQLKMSPSINSSSDT